MIFVMKFQAAAMSRANVEESERPDFCLYVDEFQNFSTDSFATIMSEARKYRLNLIVANQFTTQLSEEIRDAVFGNMGTIISFRVGQNDVEALSRYFKPIFEPDDILRVPNYNAIVRTLINGVPTQPFSMAALPSLGTPNAKLGQALMQLSAAKFGRPRAIVDEEISERMKTIEVPKPAFGSSTPAPGSLGASPAAAKPAGSGSFLDEWLAKRRTGAPTPASVTAQAPSPVTAPPVPTDPSTNPSPAAASPQAETKPAEEPQKTDGEVSLQTDNEDTIFIDREGNLQPTKSDTQQVDS